MKQSIFKNIFLLALLLTLITIPITSFAGQVYFARPGYNGISLNAVNTILQTFLNWMWILFSFTSIVMFTWAGFLFINAHGEPSKLNDARKMLIWGVVGVIIALLSVSMINIVSSIITPTAPLGGSCTTDADCGADAPNCVSGICQL